MRIVPVLLVLLLAASGCLSTKDNTSSTTSGPTGCATYDDSGRLIENNCGENETVPLPPSPGKFEIVAIDESGDMLQGVDKTWSWTTEPNATVFEVRVELHGPLGALDQIVLVDYTYLLTGGPEDKIRVGTESPGNSVNFGPGGCVLCYDGRDKDDNFGNWHLRLHIGNGTGTWSVHVATKYADAPKAAEVPVA